MPLPAIFLILRVAANRLSSQMHHLFTRAGALAGIERTAIKTGLKVGWRRPVTCATPHRISPPAPGWSDLIESWSAPALGRRRFEPGWLCLPCFRPKVAVLFVFVAMWTAGSVGQAQTSPTNQWLITLGITDSSPAVGSDGTIYLGTFNQKLWAVDSNGVSRWQFKTGSEIKSSPAIGGDGTIYFGCRDRKFYAVSPKGKKKWEFATGAWVDSSPALGRDGTIYFGSWDKHFYALNPDGTLKWQFETGGEIVSSPAVGADENIYFGSHDKKFYSLAPDGRKRWEYATGGQIISSPALNGDGVVYFTSLDGFCYALNEDGSLRWRLKTGGATESSPVIGADGMIYLGVNSFLWVITPEGTKRGERNFYLFDPIYASPTVVEDNVVYVLFDNSGLVALDADQHTVWSFSLSGHSRASPGIGADGSLCAADRYKDNVFCALNTRRSLARTPWPKFRANSRNTGHVNETSH
jgi:outer membrane protein assembly factor BamB